MVSKKKMTTEEKSSLVMAALEDKKAVNPVMIDVHERTTMTDVFIIASGTSNIHIKALVDSVTERLGKSGLKTKRLEGYNEAVWVLIDYGDVIVHIFAPEQRAFYRLEAYWSGEEKGSPPPLAH